MWVKPTHLRQTIDVKGALALHSYITDSTSPILDSQLLLCEALNKTRTWLMIHDDYALSESEQQHFVDFMEQRINGCPIAYILGTQEFWSLPFSVNKATLIPRPDTEIIVETIIQRFPNRPLNMIDLGTGSGAIAIAVAHERPRFTISATDISIDALLTAKENAYNNLDRPLNFVQCNWLDAFAHNQFNIVASNPPYITKHDLHLAKLKYEPTSALVAAEQGYADFKKIVGNAYATLVPGGMLILEHGYEQQTILIDMLKYYKFTDIEGLNDLGGQPRVTLGYKPQ